MASPAVRTAKKRAYHHGDLERGLLETAVQMIQKEGVQALTLRGVGARLGVSRTALYRHFDDKQDLLCRVAAEGFKRFHEALSTAVARAESRGADPMPAMAAAYARFARSYPSHYQTMFSGVLTREKSHPDLDRHGEAAFNVLLDAIRRGQEDGRIRAGNPVEFAEITWALSHGLATLGMANQLRSPASTLEGRARIGWAILERGLRAKQVC
jgi:AcrR family transcriptional regulator